MFFQYLKIIAEPRLQVKRQKKKGFRHPMLYEVKTKATAATKENPQYT
jgi:hypothetical protein